MAPGSAAPPARSEVQVLTVVQAPLGEWVTLAATREEAAGRSGTTYNSASASVRRTLLQMRISAQ